MSTTTASIAFIAASANRTSNSADSSSLSEVAFGSQRFVALWDLKSSISSGVYTTLPGHEGEVVCIRFVNQYSFISGDDKGYCKLWKKAHGRWIARHTFRAHEKGISALAVMDNIVVTGASDASLKVWTHSPDDEGPPNLSQTVDLDGRFPLDIQMAVLPGTARRFGTIMAVASTDRIIRIYSQAQGLFALSLRVEGHEDWVRCLAFDSSVSNALTLASGGQDGYIRLWLIEPKVDIKVPGHTTDELLDAFERSLGDFGNSGEGGRKLSNKSHILAVKESEELTRSFTFTFDALLIGHEGHVTSVAWRPNSNPTSPTAQPLPTLLSTSTDASVILWSPSASDQSLSEASTQSAPSIWLNRQRFGDVGGVRFGGFVGGLWTEHGNEVIAWGWTGGWRRWRKIAGEGHEENWAEAVAITGHYGPVKGMSWSTEGEYLISSSLDQTTRIWGPWNTRPDPGSEQTTVNGSWHELARPQVHGYDIISSAFITPDQMVSVADEKVARIFDAPKGFIRMLKAAGIQNESVKASEDKRPVGASVPPLGLSNKAAAEGDETFRDRENEVITRPPVEGELANVTLWPETEKLFGHGYELYTLSVSSAAQLIATSCKATTAEHAVVRLYDSSNWQSVGQPLQGHVLTITCIAFSPDGSMILTVSRDRTWRLFGRNIGDRGYSPLTSEKAHARIIWDCAWATEGDIFATAGRDKMVKIWQNASEDPARWKSVAVLKLTEAATAVDFSPADIDGRRRMAIGLESGEVLVYSSDVHSPLEWRLDLSLDNSFASVEQVHRLAWRPQADRTTKQLAICGEDRTLRIVNIPIETG